MSFTFTSDDLQRLEKYRLERLCNLFGDTLSRSFLYLDEHNQLTIHCAEPWMVDELLEDIRQLRWYSRIVVGAQQVSIYFAQTEIYKVTTTRSPRRSARISRTVRSTSSRSDVAGSSAY